MFILKNQQSVANSFLAELRDETIQQDPLRFRFNLERIGRFLAYEISKTLTYRSATVKSSLGEVSVNLPNDTIVLATILRAGIPLHEGFLNVFDRAENAFVGAYRVEDEGPDPSIQMEYLACPPLTGKVLIMVDPMLATGKSLVTAYKALCKKGEPAVLHIASAIGSQPGVDYIRRTLPSAQLWLGDLDPMLNQKAYIVPGLGDAGDLAYGVKS